ncbi:MAG: insulinase family protein [Phototrophicales bacterium]|nr:MAG: insulinase family protein [Phototrophicales bacterium]
MTTTSTLPGPDTITRVTLDNGITILVYENHTSQSVVIDGTVRAGSLYESPAKNGLAALTARSLMRGTTQRDFNAIFAGLENIGADLGINGGVHRAGFSGKALAEDLPVLIELLGDVLRNPSFPEEQVERLKGEIFTGLQYRQQDTRYRANRAFREGLYPASHPLHYSTSGTLETVPMLTVDDIKQFHQTHYGPADMIIVIVGDVQTDAAIDVVHNHLGDWKNPNQADVPDIPEAPQATQIQKTVIGLPGKTQSDIVLGVVGPSRTAEDYLAAALANSVLGVFGMMGRIGQEVREKQGLAYYAYSRVDGGLTPGPWYVSAGVDPNDVDKAIDSILHEIRRMVTEPVSAEDLSDNQSYFIGHLPLQLENNDGVADALLRIETYNLGLDYLIQYRDTVERLTVDDLLAAAQHYLNPDAYVSAVAGPED